MPTTRKQLQVSAQALCNDFANKSPLESLLSHFSTTHQVSAKEHGLQLLAPFLGRMFTGRSGLEEYFSLLQKYLTYENMSFGESTAIVIVIGKIALGRQLRQGDFDFRSTLL